MNAVFKHLLRHRLSILLAIILLAAGFTGGKLASAAGLNSSRVDPRVLEDTSGGNEGRFLVVLKSQADLDWLATGDQQKAVRAARVADGLRRVADASQAGVIAQLNALKAGYHSYWIANLVAVKGDRAVVEAMAARPDVAYIASDRAFRVPLESASITTQAAGGIQPNLTQIGAPAVWALGDTGQGIVYANADTGVMWNHPALINQYRGWDGSAAEHDYNWWDAIRDNSILPDQVNPCGYAISAPCDDYGHGTHVMGIGVGVDASTGMQIGVAPGAKWIACRNMDDGVGRPSTYIACLQFFLAPTDLSGNNPDPSKSPDVISNSYSCPPSEGCNPYSLQAAVEAVHAAGIFMAVSAGNSGPSCSSVSTPPALEGEVFTVGAVDSNNLIAAFSSRGPVTADGSGRLKPELSAPGVNIYSSYYNGKYTAMSGTSMAAPHVAGAVALLWSAYPALRGDLMRTDLVLENSAHHLTNDDGCGGDTLTSVPNNTYGFGVLDVLAAYRLVPELRLVFFPLIWR